MANLSRVSDVTRKILEYSAIGILALILLVLIFRIGGFIKNIIAPTPPAPPTVAFGKLQNLSFPLRTGNTNYSYTVNTLTGSLPTLPDRVTVYKLQQPAPNLLGLDKAKQIAAGAEFLSSPIALSDTSYTWTKTDPFPTTLTMNIQSFDFLLTSSYQTDQTVLSGVNIPDETTAEGFAKEFFDKFMPLPTNIDASKTKTTLFAIQPTGLIPATSLSHAQVIRIDYFPKAIDTLPIFTANPTKSLIYALVVSGTTGFPQLAEAQYYHKNTTNESATYPIISSQLAYEDLKQGKGYIAANPTGDTNVTITDVSLGYYVDNSPQQYLWPIIVFQGDKGFYAYVSAVQDNWIQK